MLPKSSPETSSPFGMPCVEPYVPGENELYLNPKQMAYFENLLMAWRKQLKETMQRAQQLFPEEGLNLPDIVDRATQEEELILNIKNRERGVQLIYKVERALKKLQNDEFGYCDNCGEEIGFYRLQARPTAFLCIECKEVSEKRKKTSFSVKRNPSASA